MIAIIRCVFGALTKHAPITHIQNNTETVVVTVLLALWTCTAVTAKHVPQAPAHQQLPSCILPYIPISKCQPYPHHGSTISTVHLPMTCPAPQSVPSRSPLSPSGTGAKPSPSYPHRCDICPWTFSTSWLPHHLPGGLLGRHVICPGTFSCLSLSSWTSWLPHPLPYELVAASSFALGFLGCRRGGCQNQGTSALACATAAAASFLGIRRPVAVL